MMESCAKNMNLNISSYRINYVSCIKIDGTPILPPLFIRLLDHGSKPLTEEDRVEMRKYRALAIKIQDKLNRLKSSCLSDSSFLTDSDSIDNYSSSSIVSIFTDYSIEDSTTKFSEGCTDVLNMLEDKYNDDYIEKPSKDMPKLDTVPLSKDCDDSNNIRENFKERDKSDIREIDKSRECDNNEGRGDVTEMEKNPEVRHMDRSGDNKKMEISGDIKGTERGGDIKQIESSGDIRNMTMERSRDVKQMERVGDIIQMEGDIRQMEGNLRQMERNKYGREIENIGDARQMERSGDVRQMEVSGIVREMERSVNGRQSENISKMGNVQNLGQIKDNIDFSQIGNFNIIQMENFNLAQMENFVIRQTEINVDLIKTHRQFSHTIDKNKKVFPDEILKLYACADNLDVESKPICDNNISKLDVDKRNSNSESNDGYLTANENLDDIKSPPKLIRSKSFILEKPSPFLLAQIEQQKNKSPMNKRKTWVQKPLILSETKNVKSQLKRCSSNDITKKNAVTDKKPGPKRRFSADETKRHRGSTSNVSATPPRRKGWDLKNARAKWSSIENDLSTIIDHNKYKNKNKFCSLPSSMTPSPTTKMFGSKTKTKNDNFYMIQPKIDSNTKISIKSNSSRKNSARKELNTKNNDPTMKGETNAKIDTNPKDDINEDLVIPKTPKIKEVPNLFIGERSTKTKPLRVVKGFITPQSKSARINLFNTPKESISPPKNICFSRKLYTPPPKETHVTPPKESHVSSSKELQVLPLKESYVPPLEESHVIVPKELYIPPPKESHVSPPYLSSTPRDSYVSTPKTSYQSPPQESYTTPPKELYAPSPKELYSSSKELYTSQSKELCPLLPKESYSLPLKESSPLPLNETYPLPLKESYPLPLNESYPLQPKEIYPSPRKKTCISPHPILQRKIDYINKPLSPCYFVSEKDKTTIQNQILESPKNVKSDIILPEKESPNEPLQILFNNQKDSESNTYSNELNLEQKNSDEQSLSLKSSTKSDLKDIFNKMQHIQKIQLFELMKKQKEEQEMFLRAFAEQQTFLLSKLSEAYTQPVPVCNSKNNNMYTELMNTSEKLLHECKQILDNNNKEAELLNENCDSIYISDSSQTMFTSTFGSNDTLNDSNLTLHNEVVSEQPTDDVTKNNNNDLQVITSREFNRSISNDSLELAEHSKSSYYNGDKIVAKIEKNITVCIEPKIEDKKRIKQYTPEQIDAVTIINAASRGYLVRRLFRSERVQNLIQTIKDTLICAMELHHENVEKIQPADIELHRRLIQQVTAACTSFHDVFFKLTLKEQMAVIALDRQRKKDKLLKPLLSKSPSLSSTTQKRIEKKLKRNNSADYSSSSNRSSFSRSCHSAESKKQIKSLELSESAQNKKSNITQESVRRSTGSTGTANKKPWR